MHKQDPPAPRLEAPRPFVGPAHPGGQPLPAKLLDSTINVPFFKRPKSVDGYTSRGEILETRRASLREIVLELGEPIVDHGDPWRCRCFLDRLRDEKPLSVGGDGVAHLPEIGGFELE